MGDKNVGHIGAQTKGDKPGKACDYTMVSVSQSASMTVLLYAVV